MTNTLGTIKTRSTSSPAVANETNKLPAGKANARAYTLLLDAIADWMERNGIAIESQDGSHQADRRSRVKVG